MRTSACAAIDAQAMSQVLAITLPLFALVGAGFLAVRTGLLAPVVVAGLGQLVFGLEIPAVLFRSLAGQDFSQGFDIRINLAYFGGCFLVFAASLMIGLFAFGLNRAQAGVFGFSAMYSNSSLLGVPLIQAAFGASGLALLGKIIAFHSLLLIPVATLVVASGQNGRASLAMALDRSVRATLGNPIVLGLIAGIAWNLTGLGLAPSVDRVTTMLSEAATPTALLALGGMQGAIGRQQIRQAGASVALKLVAHPLLVYLLASALGGLSREAIAVATITAALPAGMNVYLMAQRYDCYLAEATAATSLGTLLSVLSIGAALGIAFA